MTQSDLESAINDYCEKKSIEGGWKLKERLTVKVLVQFDYQDYALVEVIKG
jgi:hypothetical protein